MSTGPSLRRGACSLGWSSLFLASWDVAMYMAMRAQWDLPGPYRPRAGCTTWGVVGTKLGLGPTFAARPCRWAPWVRGACAIGCCDGLSRRLGHIASCHRLLVLVAGVQGQVRYLPRLSASDNLGGASGGITIDDQTVHHGSSTTAGPRCVTPSTNTSLPPSEEGARA